MQTFLIIIIIIIIIIADLVLYDLDSRIVELLLALLLGLLMRGMREFEWEFLIILFSMAIGSRRIILRLPTMNTWSD